MTTTSQNDILFARAQKTTPGELLRIGVALISQIDLATLQNVLAGLPQLKTGRPKKD